MSAPDLSLLARRRFAPLFVVQFLGAFNDNLLKFALLFLANFGPSMTDGIKTDMDGNVWCSMGWGDPNEDGVRCYTPAGELIGKIHLPETCANLCFGGKRKNRLFMTASTSVYAVYVETVGAMVP